MSQEKEKHGSEESKYYFELLLVLLVQNSK